MAVAVINHADLVKFVDELGFPKYTKVTLVPEGYGYQVFDKFIRSHIRWVSQLEVDPETHVRIGESADHINVIHDLWTIRSQRFIEGSEEHNAFNEITGDDGESFSTHVNREAIREAVVAGRHRYILDYILDDDGAIVTKDFMTVAVFDSPEDSSLAYISHLPIEKAFSLKVELLGIDGQPGDTPALYKRPYVQDYHEEEKNPWEFVGYMTEEEYTAWCMYNTVESTDVDFREIDPRQQAIKKARAALPDITKGIAHLAS